MSYILLWYIEVKDVVDNGAAFYIPNFVDTKEVEVLLYNIRKATPQIKWQTLQNRFTLAWLKSEVVNHNTRRLQMWGGKPTMKGMISEPFPSWLTCYAQRIADISPNPFKHVGSTYCVYYYYSQSKTIAGEGSCKFEKPNHCLINEYLVGQGRQHTNKWNTLTNIVHRLQWRNYGTWRWSIVLPNYCNNLTKLSCNS